VGDALSVPVLRRARDVPILVYTTDVSALDLTAGEGIRRVDGDAVAPVGQLAVAVTGLAGMQPMGRMTT
jgi:hypothetical protein